MENDNTKKVATGTPLEKSEISRRRKSYKKSWELTQQTEGLDAVQGELGTEKKK